MGSKAKTTDAAKILRLVWANACDGTGHSWERVNHSMQQALRLVVGAGFKLTVADFQSLDDLRPGYWLGDPEWVYSLAVAEGNLPTAQAYEEWVGRAPLIADDVSPSGAAGFGHSSGPRQQERLHVGARFTYRGEKVKVTSLSRDGVAVACSYHPPKDKGGYDRESKVKRRHSITRDDIIAERADRKELDAIQKELLSLAGPKVTTAQIVSELGVKTMAEFLALPVKRARRVLEKVRKAAA